MLHRGSTSEERDALENRFAREVNMMSRVKHENLVKVRIEVNCLPVGFPLCGFYYNYYIGEYLFSLYCIAIYDLPYLFSFKVGWYIYGLCSLLEPARIH